MAKKDISFLVVSFPVNMISVLDVRVMEIAQTVGAIHTRSSSSSGNRWVGFDVSTKEVEKLQKLLRAISRKIKCSIQIP